jgi:Aspartyl protease
MKIRLGHGLAYVEATLSFRGRDLRVGDVILDTGSAGTIFSVDRLLEVGIVPEGGDALQRIRGIGGTEFVFMKRLDHLSVGELEVPAFEVEVGAMAYGFPGEGVLGLDFLLQSGALIDLRRLELHRASAA